MWVVVLFPPWWKGRNARGARPSGIGLPLTDRNAPTRPNALQAFGKVTGGSQPQTMTPQSMNPQGGPMSAAGASSTVVPLFGRSGEHMNAAQMNAAQMNEMQPMDGNVQATGPAADQFFRGDGMDLSAAPMTRESARRRRRNVLVGLFGLALINLVLAVTQGGGWVLLSLITMAAFLGFVMLVVQHQRSEVERMTKVRPIRPAGHQNPVQAAPSYLVQDRASQG